jgi:hypothetical protein
MVSLISMPDDNAGSAAEVSRSAVLFGLHIFFSGVIGAESGEDLGSVEVCCCISRKTSPREFQLIERAVCLAAVAIKRHRETIDGSNCRIHGVRSARGLCAGNADFDELTVTQHVEASVWKLSFCAAVLLTRAGRRLKVKF